MLTLRDGLLGRDIDLGVAEVTADELRAYAEAVGDPGIDGALSVAPLSFLLALRGAPQPAVELRHGTVGVHGGHLITSHRPLIVPGRYAVRARLAEVFEKSGRSGPLTVLVRRVRIATPDGATVASVEDQQIVRWRRAESAARHPPTRTPRAQREARPIDSAPPCGELDVGGVVARHCAAPDAGAIARYARRLPGGEPMFTDAAYARSLGYADVIVPGPLQSAMLETFLRRQFTGLAARRLGLTFRVPLPASEPMTLMAVVIERRVGEGRAVLTCDLSIENADGERAAVGTAELVDTR